MPTSPRAKAILAFWFGDRSASDNGQDHDGQYRKAWFIKSDAFDDQIRQQFLDDVQKASSGEYDGWKNDAMSAVALLLLLDQFPRNLYRGDPRSFGTDEQALALAQYLVDTGMDKTLIPAQRFFVYVPFEHSENRVDQQRCVDLMRSLNEEFPDLDPGFEGGLDYAIRHQAVIERFGRFPHRNEVLGRTSTPEEVEFLKQPGSRF